jgi:hypothetical protein
MKRQHGRIKEPWKACPELSDVLPWPKLQDLTVRWPMAPISGLVIGLLLKIKRNPK